MQKINYSQIINLNMGLDYSKDKSTFTVFAPGRDKLKLALYDNYDDVRRKEHELNYIGDSVFSLTIKGDLNGKYYTYLVEDMEVTDPYSFASSINSRKSAIIDLNKTNPQGFKDHIIPKNDWKSAILYEVHVGDYSGHKSSGTKYKGKFLGMADETSFYEEVETGIKHMVDLGVTHVHLMPVYDFITVDESKNIDDYKNNYNWGYDPELFNNLEGSYSTDPYNPNSRIYEFKYLVQKLHENNISVILDVVYNHTFKTFDSNFNTLAPGYYHRNKDNIFYNGSGCGNEFASEKPMARKFLIESLKFWVEEYKVDGFRFDLMALIDIDTVEQAIEELRIINPEIMIYGEPWMAQESLLPYEKQVYIGAQKNRGFAIFNPFFRDSIRGDNDSSGIGYLQGDYSLKPEIEKGIMGSIQGSEGDVFFDKASETINYFNAHDNLIFQDKLVKSKVLKKNQKAMTRLAFSILMFSQGIPFFHAGNEFMRDKKLDHNSYRSSIKINGIDWKLKKENFDLFNDVKEIIRFRKESGIFNLDEKDDIIKRIHMIKSLKTSIIGYIINSDDGFSYLIFHNASDKAEKIKTTKIKDSFNLIWSNGPVDEIEQDIIIDGYSSKVYKLKGVINEL